MEQYTNKNEVRMHTQIHRVMLQSELNFSDGPTGKMCIYKHLKPRRDILGNQNGNPSLISGSTSGRGFWIINIIKLAFSLHNQGGRKKGSSLFL